ncbi:MAG: Asp-tRNA(Asn)/Glu-tRNA(Gln) amidotransferase GatCAB subunit A [Candidatus Dactylopiibacterium carminicum]|uniref:Glutamyl-tRNA(Gln) amidotransferase subunit A n=1 Tax=Candidatus Dactylopiibacterium carminicum TaxID=857335 RepID=A0A272EWR5_9RHOO|nr:Asp-tRNA(Asn)/Glu-tRNA(Gln) amidotransferase subunit GatA [Candidatus Dactylopiibacterium carminicum]KAF7600058.1 Asp-tRNA(Asn)/Glu-tRNA(Gln) amidotransferase subunit GatA [Candidatus Dactylopiibacterium carminicum]PAS94552.1 MAG: Asp-tRNA(Asn)/Glu-tRNA(Gln) amidotransferase GatCAB subunit A [Candidatus Dactylopiibacterium carminicum]PAS97591.1 MAG: Asp-tRNA(Asn)/Glu-tRNA(Gln) amidotransferase GatCAB subunit A [Candidatus Dactylopiibacterium carminicum]PAT00060.1 MAG: aspartyl/glutamyl-tRNA 
MSLQTLKSLQKQLASKQISSRELVTDHLARVEAHNTALNAFITLDRDGALAAAEAADKAIAAGTAGPLAGLPIAHKDIFCTEGVLTTCGSKILSNFVSPYDATVVARLKAAGTVSLGKTNLDEFAMGSTNESSFFGAAKNPWNLAHVPGGSSGGSAAAVAAGLVPAATGTDTGGSIRQPASFCGITGIKPTYGTVSRYGMIAYASSLDQGGPLAHTAEDCALLLDAISGFDERDSTSLQRAATQTTAELDRPLAGLKIGLPREYFGEGLAGDVRTAIEAALAELRKLGATTVEVSLPNTHLAIPAYYVIAPAEASSNLSRFDGVRYGHRASEYKDLAEMYSRSRAEGFGAEVKRRILVGTYVLSHGYYDAYYIKAQQLRRLIAEDFKQALAQCDVIAGPVAPTTAPVLGQMADDPVQMYLSDIYTLGVNLAGLPGLSAPCGFGANGLPVGLQLIGNYFAEARLLNVAHQFQQATDWHLRSPAHRAG